MFTGIVEAVGEVRDVEEGRGLRSLRIAAPPALLLGTKPGSSIAVDGACLTPVDVADESFTVQAVTSTLSRTVAGEYRTGRMVNLERPLAFGGRVDGHLVQGHVDGIGRLIRVRGEEGLRMLEASIPRGVHSTTLLHGSIALNGVSLTVSRIEPPDRIQVAIIPHTWEVTNFRWLGCGDALNVEGDLIGKYVGKLLARAGDGPVPRFRDGESDRGL